MRTRTVLLALPLALGLSSLAHADEARRPPQPLSSAKLMEGDGCISKTADSVCSPASAGHTVPTFGWFVAGPGGASLQTPAGLKIRLEQGSRLQVLEHIVVRGNRVNFVDADQLLLSRGRAHLTVPPVQEEQVRKGAFVRGPFPTAAIVQAGTTEVKAVDQALTVGVISGPGAVILRDKEQFWVQPGWARLVRLGGGNHLRHLPDAPETFNCRTLAFAGTQLSEPVTVRWHRGGEARSYEVVLFRASDEKPVARAVVSSDDNEARFSTVSSGNYVARVRGIDLDGFGGPWSPPLRVDVVGARLPVDARVGTDGQVVIPQGEAIELTHTDGLVAEQLRAPGPTPAPSRLTMDSRFPNLIRLHRPGDGESISLRVAPLEVKAAVDFLPTTQGGRDAGVAIMVRLYAEDGGALPVKVGARPVALLDGVTLDVPWKRRGDALMAVVPLSKAAQGELRVRVMNRQGQQIGEGQWGSAQSQVAMSGAPRGAALGGGASATGPLTASARGAGR